MIGLWILYGDMIGPWILYHDIKNLVPGYYIVILKIWFLDIIS